MSQATILIIGFVWPEPNSSAAGTRMMQLIALFKGRNWKIVFASAASDSEYMSDLEILNISRKSITLNDSDFDTFVAALNPSIVLFDRFMTEEQFGWRVTNQCPNALRILDTEDLHCLRQSRQKAVKENRQFNTNDLLTEEIAKREIASILRCDISLIISEFEMNLLQQTFKISVELLHYMPLFIQHEKEVLPFEKRKNFVFIGNFWHEPNKDAAFYLKQHIWPRIRKQLPSAVLDIYGAYPSQSVLQLNNIKEHFLVHGRANDASQVIKNAKIMLAPLRFGAGIKGKLLEAMQLGTPSITTTVGAEAMQGELPWNGFISDNPQEMANAAVSLYNDENLWDIAQKNGFEIIDKRHLLQLFESDFFQHLENLQQSLIQHRISNFTGAMLQHHTMRSTEFLSRWIEAKNKQLL